jgi:hypothetical protein
MHDPSNSRTWFAGPAQGNLIAGGRRTRFGSECVRALDDDDLVDGGT